LERIHADLDQHVEPGRNTVVERSVDRYIPHPFGEAEMTIG
jgi:hypothetical protein